jgi:hypothetical protein
MNKNKIIEREFFILKINEPNKNFRRYPLELIESWIKNIDENGYDLEYAIDAKSKEIQYEYTNSELVCGLVTKLKIKDNILYGNVKFFIEGFKSEEIYSKKINLDDCVIIPKGKAEVRDGIVQNNYKLFGFNLVNKNQSSFVF